MRSARQFAAFAKALQLLDVLPFAPSYHGRIDENFTPLGHRHDTVGNLVHRLTANFLTAFRTVWNADSREQQTELVVNFRDRTHRRTGVVRSGFLIDGNCGGKPFDTLDVRLFHLS